MTMHRRATGTAGSSARTAALAVSDEGRPRFSAAPPSARVHRFPHREEARTRTPHTERRRGAGIREHVSVQRRSAAVSSSMTTPSTRASALTASTVWAPCGSSTSSAHAARLGAVAGVCIPLRAAPRCSDRRRCEGSAKAAREGKSRMRLATRTRAPEPATARCAPARADRTHPFQERVKVRGRFLLHGAQQRKRDVFLLRVCTKVHPSTPPRTPAPASARAKRAPAERTHAKHHRLAARPAAPSTSSDKGATAGLRPPWRHSSWRGMRLAATQEQQPVRMCVLVG